MSIHTEHKYLHVFAHLKGLSTYLFPQTSLSPIFPIMFLSSTWPSSQNIAASQWIHTDSYPWPFLFPRKMHNQMHCSIFLPSGRISLHYCPSEMSQKGAVLGSCLLVVGVCLLYSTICKSVSVFSSSVNWLKGTLYEARCAGWEREGNIAGMGVMGVWTTSSCNLLMHSQPAWA